jgi:hypothetical protein
VAHDDSARLGGATAADPRGGWFVAAFGWFLVAAALRAAGLAQFSFWSDEVYTLENSEQLFGPAMKPSALAFPLCFLLERGAIELARFLGADVGSTATLQWVLRVVPAACGALAAAAAFATTRGVLRRGERHVLAALIAFSPWFLWMSQMARFYALALFFSVPATFALLRAQRDGDRRAAWFGVAWIVASLATHPSAGLLLAGHLAACLAAAMLRIKPLSRAILPPLLVPAAAAAIGVAVPAIRETIAYRWNAQDAGLESAAGLVLGLGFNFGPVVGALSLLGWPTLWRRDRSLAVHVAVGVGLPVAAVLVLAMQGRAVEQRYLVGLMPLALLPAAAFVGELSERAAGALRGAHLAVPAAALVAWLPGVVSAGVDGDRHDLSGALAFVSERLEPADGIVCETHALARRYLAPDFPAARLIEAPPPRDEGDEWKSMWKECRRLWVVVQAEFEEMNEETRSFQRWAWQEGRLVREFWRPRLDYHQNRLRVFLVETDRARRWHRDLKAR